MTLPPAAWLAGASVGSLVGAGSHLVANQLLSQVTGRRLSFGEWVLYGMPFGMVASGAACAVIITLFLDPGLGLLLLTGVGVWMLWSNVMTTVTSLRFEKPRISAAWLLVFPFGGVVGRAYLIWILVHFDWVYG